MLSIDAALSSVQGDSQITILFIICTTSPLIFASDCLILQTPARSLGLPGARASAMSRHGGGRYGEGLFHDRSLSLELPPARHHHISSGLSRGLKPLLFQGFFPIHIVVFVSTDVIVLCGFYWKLPGTCPNGHGLPGFKLDEQSKSELWCLPVLGVVYLLYHHIDLRYRTEGLWRPIFSAVDP